MSETALRASRPAIWKWRITIPGMAASRCRGARGMASGPGSIGSPWLKPFAARQSSESKNASKPKVGQKRINNDTNFLEASFGKNDIALCSRLENVDQAHAGHGKTDRMRVFVDSSGHGNERRSTGDSSYSPRHSGLRRGVPKSSGRYIWCPRNAVRTATSDVDSS